MSAHRPGHCAPRRAARHKMCALAAGLAPAVRAYAQTRQAPGAGLVLSWEQDDWTRSGAPHGGADPLQVVAELDRLAGLLADFSVVLDAIDAAHLTTARAMSLIRPGTPIDRMPGELVGELHELRLAAAARAGWDAAAQAGLVRGNLVLQHHPQACEKTFLIAHSDLHQATGAGADTLTEAVDAYAHPHPDRAERALAVLAAHDPC